MVDGAFLGQVTTAPCASVSQCEMRNHLLPFCLYSKCYNMLRLLPRVTHKTS